MKPLISIIVPVYKVEKYLNRCIDSIINQTYTSLEIILVNDGSPDDCGRICDYYVTQDNRIKVIHKENGGLSSARNIGLNLATGLYIGFVDSDDWIESDMFEKLIDVAERENADVVQCGFQSVLDDGNVKRKYVFANECYCDNTEVLSAYFSQTKINVVMWNKLYRSYLFDSLRMVEGRLYEDSMISIELILRTKKFISINERCYNYLQRNESITGDYFSLKKLDMIFAGNYVLSKCEINAPKYINHCHILICMYCFYLYNDLKHSSISSKYEIEQFILDEFFRHFNIVKNTKEFKGTRINNKILINVFGFNQSIAVRIYSLYCRIKSMQ